MKLWHPLSLLAVLFINCGHDPTILTTSENVVVIINDTFLPQELKAVAGETIFFQNRDAYAHHILSASGKDLFDNTGDFDQIVLEDAAASIVVPATATTGTVFFFYDDILQAAGETPTGTITVE